jgi:ectoine hydroxylase-related dioxygenase (phytanoyl-CoA dioxygenase family)
MSNPYIYYPELIESSFWGTDKVLIKEDINLLEKTEFNSKGYNIFSIKEHNDFLKKFISSNISIIIGKDLDIERYHDCVNEEQHKQILNSMPYKKNDNSSLYIFSEYLEEFMSDLLKEKVKIFNDDIWVRICRPTKISNKDFNPCHRDVYLDFYRNTVNIYLPIIGSNESSSLFVEESSHLWNENMTSTTHGGAYFKNIDKKYSVDAIVQSKIELNMIRPNPGINEMLVFSPYLIHGCSDNKNEDTTRMSLEIRFIMNNEEGLKQEDNFNTFIKQRNWR